jgi:hypothetical protein
MTDKKSPPKIPVAASVALAPTATSVALAMAPAASAPVEREPTSKGPRYKEKMRLSPEDEDLPFNARPMIWRDLAEFAARHSRTIADMVYDMVLLTNHAYSTKTPLRTVVPFDLEFLTRLYEMYPTSCSWVRPTIRQAFDLIYGEHIKTFSKRNEPAARLAIGRRYAKMLGRVDTAQYRWLAEDGNITRRLSNILSKVEEAAKVGHDPREVFEGVGRQIWRLRGFDIEKRFPLPTPESVEKPPGMPGRAMSKKSSKKPVVAVYQGGAFS